MKNEKEKKAALIFIDSTNKVAYIYIDQAEALYRWAFNFFDFLAGGLKKSFLNCFQLVSDGSFAVGLFVSFQFYFNKDATDVSSHQPSSSSSYS